MKIGGIVLMIAGIALFVWHFLMGEWDPTYRYGYATHQVMSVDSVILLFVGVIFYFWGRHRHRHKRRTLTAPNESVPPKR